MTQRHILFIDDRDINAGFAQSPMASDLGQPLWRTIRSVDQFSAAVARADFDAVVCGDGLPGLSGLDILARIKQLAGQVPVIFLSAHDDPSTARAYLDAGANDHAALSQPWRVRAALAHLSSLLQACEARRDLSFAEQDMDMLSYAVSHDLRAPLRAINGYATLLHQDKHEQLDEEMQRFLGAIRSSATHMGTLIDDLLELVRVSRGPLRMQAVDISQLATHVVQQLHRAEPTRRVSVDIASGIVVHGDPVLLHRALEKLIDNAWKYSAHAAQAAVTLCPWRDAEVGTEGFCLTDNGVGFPGAQAARLFEPFVRLHATSEFRSGSGTGLTLVQRIVRRHHGRVWAELRGDQGATFFVALPAPAAAVDSS